MTQSNFKIPDQFLVHEGEEFYRLEAGLCRDQVDCKLVIKSRKRSKKVIEKNDVPYGRLAEHIGFMPTVMVGPDDIDLITSGNSIRRTMLDRTISQVDPAYLLHSINYARLQKQRNALLKQFLEGRKYDEVLLSTYDHKMSDPAHYIYQSRKEFLENFQPTLTDIYSSLSGGDEVVMVLYENQIGEADYLEVTAVNRARDRILGRTTTGPHADKLLYQINSKDMKSFASQGQKKSAIFATKLAQYKYLAAATGLKPILLLDDIFDRLDHQRVDRLVEIILKDTFGQIFITDIESTRVDSFFPKVNFDVKRIEIATQE